MRGYIYLLVLLFGSCSQQQKKDDPESSIDKVLGFYVQSVKELQNQTEQLEGLAIQFEDSVAIRNAFQDSRNKYKEIEALFEYYNPELGKKINGPAITKNDIHAPERIIRPTGFQVLEELIFPVFDSASKEEIIQEAKRINTRMKLISRDAEFLQLNNENVFEALKGEFVRVGSLGLSAFDCPVTMNAIPEVGHALIGVKEVLDIYAAQVSEELRNENNLKFEKAFEYLQKNNQFLEFNRLEFITEHLQPLYKQLFIVQEALNIANNTFATPVDYSNSTLFTNDFFEINFFAPNDNKLPNQPAIELGKSLFYDQRLSSDNSRSCATCHNPDKAFTDGLPKSIAVNGSPVKRNSPTLLNAGYQQHQFYDSRVQLLETQIKDVIGNADEMHGDFIHATGKISDESAYKTLTSNAYGTDSITTEEVLKALSSYVRSLASFNSRFDKYLAGDKSQLTSQEIKGFDLYMGKAKCGTCHFTPLFNGTLPPHYMDSESEVIGVPAESVITEATIDQDSGRYYKYGGNYNLFAFKTPTVRNAELTAPYMHNGVYETLDEVMDFYNRGGGAGIGIDLEHQTLPTDPLNLTEEEIQNVIAFIKTLTDNSGTAYSTGKEIAEVN